jgi:hypothetical protein
LPQGSAVVGPAEPIRTGSRTQDLGGAAGVQ